MDWTGPMVECEGGGAFMALDAPPAADCEVCGRRMPITDSTAPQMLLHKRPVTKAEIQAAGDTVFRNRLREARDGS